MTIAVPMAAAPRRLSLSNAKTGEGAFEHRVALFRSWSERTLADVRLQKSGYFFIFGFTIKLLMKTWILYM